MSSSGWPLVGRAEEIEYVRDALGGAGPARGAVLAGAPGVGKTRLAREVAAERAGCGATVRWVTGTETGKSMPLGAFAGLIGKLAGDQSQILRTAMQALVGPSPHGTFVCVDDAHHLDDLSAVLLLQVALQDRASVLITVRSHEPAPAAVSALWTQAILPRVELQALSDTEAAQVVATALDGPVAERTASQLVALARGNMLYLRQVIEGELTAGRLAIERGRWAWHGGFEPSAELADLVGQSLDDLTPAASEVLDVLAVAGPMKFAVLRRVCDASKIEAAEQAGIVEVVELRGAMEVRPYHPLFAEIRRDQIGQLAARRIRGQVAEALSVDRNAPGVLLRRALLALASDLSPDPQLLSAGAYHALDRLDWDLARRLAQAAVDAGGGSNARLALACALAFGQRAEDAELIFAELCHPELELADRSRVIMSRAAHSFWFLRRPVAAKALLADEIKETSDLSVVAALSAMLALFEVSSGDLEVGLARIERVDTNYLIHPMGRLCATWALVVGQGFTRGIGDLRDAAREVYRSAGGVVALSQPRIGLAEYLVNVLLLAGQVDEANDLAAVVDADVDMGLPGPRHTVEVVMAQAALGAGDLRRSRDLAASAVDGLDGRDTSGWVLRALLPYIVASALLGDRSAAREGCLRLEEHRHPAHVLAEPDIRLASAWTMACSGATSAGVAHALEAADWAREHHQAASELLALQTVVRLGDPSVLSRIQGLATSLSGPRAPAALAHARALAQNDGPALVAASRLIEELGDRLGAADAAAQAVQAFARQGLRGSQAGAMERATRLQRACDGARTPALVAATQPLPLTRRERELVTLAAQGLSNQQIADRLVVSVRTVEGHLYRAGSKLGFERRREFATLFE